MEQRYDIYRNVHKGLRRELASLLVDVGQLDTDDARQAARLVERWRIAKNLLDHHHTHEDEHLGPHLGLIAPALASELEMEHETLHAETDRLIERSESVLAGVPGAAHAFYLDFVAFVSRYFLHMDKEERITNAALQRAFTDRELAEIEAKLVASIQPDMVEPFFARMLPAMNPAEREALLRDVKEHAPQPVFFGMWAIAKNALDVPSFLVLQKRLDVGEVPYV